MFRLVYCPAMRLDPEEGGPQMVESLIKSSTGPATEKIVRFFPSLVLPQHDEQAAVKQNLSFDVFCRRLGYQEDASFRLNGQAQQPDDAQGTAGIPQDHRAQCYAALRRHLRAAGDVKAVVIGSLDDLHTDKEELALMLLEMERMGTRVFLADGKAVDPNSIVAGTWPMPVPAPIDVRERIKTAMRNRAIKGEGLGKPPYGYHIGPRKKLEIVPEEAEHVRLIFTLYTQKDQGIRLIVRYLNEHEIFTRKGRNWSMVTIRDILRNRTYLGTYTRFGLRVPGSHPAIITPDMFRWAQAKMESRKPKRTSVQSDPFVLSGLIYCGECGNRMVGVTRRQAWVRRKDGSRNEKEYRYYQCQSRTNQGVCKYHTHKAETLESRIMEILKAEQPRLAGMKGPRGPWSSATALLRERRKLQAAREKLDLRIKRSIRQVQAGKLSLQRFRSSSSSLLQSRQDLQEALDALANGHDPARALTPGQQAVQAIDRLAASWASMDFAEKRDLLARLIDRVNVFDERLAIILRPELTEAPAASGVA